MIIHGPLSRYQQLKSQQQLSYFNAANGFSYMCLGETVIILFAVQLGCPDYYISILGAMIYFGFIMLPLGKVVAAKIGAAQSQSLFWILRCIAALLVALSAILIQISGYVPALIALTLGAFGFYAFRSAGVVMINPLIGNITLPKDRARYLGRNSGIFYFFALVAVLVIAGVLAVNSSLWMLTAIIVAGALMGFFSSGFLRKIDESDSLRESAGKPILRSLWSAWGEPALRKQLAASFVINLSVILMIPTSMLILKRGFGVSDTDALLYSAVQLAGSALLSVLAGKLTARFGPWKIVQASFTLFTVIGLTWLVLPLSAPWYLRLVPFFVAGGIFVALSNAMAHFLLNQIPIGKQVPSSIILSVGAGAGAGIAGMLISSPLLKFFSTYNTPETPLLGYRGYFFLASLLTAAFLLVVRRLDREI